MRLAGFAVALGLIAGLIGGGSVRHLPKFRMRLMSLGLVWVVGSMIATTLNGTVGVVVFGLAMLSGVAFAATNALRWAGLAAVGFGLLLNTLVLGLNGAMPYDPTAAESAGLVPSGPVLLRTDGLTRPFRDGDQLLLLARRIPVAPLRAVTSVGDLLVAFGLGLAVFNAATDRGRARPHRGRHRAGDLDPAGQRGVVTFGAIVEPKGPAPLDIAIQVATVADDPVVLVDLTTTDTNDPHFASELTARAAVRAVLHRHGLPALEPDGATS